MVKLPIFFPFRKKSTLADANRSHFRSSEWTGIRKKVVVQTTVGGIAFMLWFLACLSYLYGTLYLSNNRHNALHVLAVDYDGGAIGQALKASYEQLKGDNFFTVDFHSADEYNSIDDLHKAVWDGDYWAAIGATEGASARLSAALQGGDAAASYNPAGALHYVWNQQYYTTFTNSIIATHMQQLVSGTRLAYNKINGTQASAALNATSPAAVQALLNPIQASATNIAPAAFGTVILFNTVSMAMPILQQFFFLLVLNGVLGAHQLYLKMTVPASLIFRRVAGILFTLGAALCQTGLYWAFREKWGVAGKEFVLTWMTLWLLMHIHLLILDTISTLAPLPVMPFVVLLWVLTNIASTLSPLELQAGFYRLGYALPSNEAYSVLMTIWAKGAHNRLYRALPILFAWWLLANVTTSLAHFRACHLAFKQARDAEENDKKDALDQIPEAKDEEEGGIKEEVEAASTTATPAKEKQDPLTLQNTLSRKQTRLDRQRTRELETRQVYGPSIPPFA